MNEELSKGNGMDHYENGTPLSPVDAISLSFCFSAEEIRSSLAAISRAFAPKILDKTVILPYK